MFRLDARQFLFSVTVLLMCTFSRANTTQISPCGCGDDAPQIQQAIETATQGGATAGTVVLQGSFELQQSVSISRRNVTLRPGSAGASISAPNIEAFFVLAGGNGLTIRGLTIRAKRGIVKLQSPDTAVPNVSIVENTFDTLTRGVVLFDGNAISSGWIVRKNTFLATDPSACPTGISCAAVLATGARGIIADNTIKYAGRGSGLVVQNNNGLTAVNTDGGFGWSVTGNTIDADLSIWVNGGSFNSIASNQTTAAGSQGVVISAGDPAEVFSGTVISAERNEVTGNLLAKKNSAAVIVGAGAIANTIARNVVAVPVGAIGMDVGPDFNAEPTVTVGPAASNQIYENGILSAGVGMVLRLNTADNIVVGNVILLANPPAQGIVQESTTNGNIVQENFVR